MKSIVVCVATLVAAIAGGCVLQAAEAQAPKVAQAVAQPSPAGTWTRAGSLRRWRM